MLKIDLTKKDNKITAVSAVRVQLLKMPYFTTNEEDEGLKVQVYSTADNALYDRLFATDDEGDYVDVSEEAEAKRKAFEEAITYVNEEETAFGKVVASGLGWYTGKAVVREFVPVYDLAKAYARAYKGADSWSEERKADFVAIKKATVEAVKSITERSGYTVPESYQISSKNMNNFLDGIYSIKATTSKSVGRTTIWSMVDLGRAFSIWSRSVVHSLGMSTDEKGKKAVDVF